MKQVNQKFKIQKNLSIITILVGIILVTYMITVEDELGALPLFLIIAGIIWFIIIQYKITKQLR